MAGVLDTVLFFFFFPANYFLPKEKQKKVFNLVAIAIHMNMHHGVGDWSWLHLRAPDR